MLTPYRDSELVGPCVSCSRMARRTCQRCGAPVCERDMLSAWDACYDCDAIIQEAARGDLPNPDTALSTAGFLGTAFGYPGLLPLWAMISPTLALLGALSFVGGLTLLAIQRRRTIRYREDIVAGSLPLPGRSQWMLVAGND